MRFPILTKTTLFAASLVIGATLSRAEPYSSSDGTFFSQYSDRKIEVDNNVNLTISTDFFGEGDLIKSGSGVLQISGETASPYRSGKDSAHEVNWVVVKATIAEDEIESVKVTELPAYYPSWTGGEILVKSGILSISGYVNLWEDYGSKVNSMVEGMPIDGRMAGVDKITLWDNARLNVGQSRFLYNGYSVVGSGSDNVFVFLHNLRAGEGNDQANSILDVGNNNRDSAKVVDDIYHVNIHVDAWGSTAKALRDGGSVGIIEGDANIYKTGGGKLALLNESENYTGAFYVAGGSVVLAAPVNDDISVDVTGALKKAGYGDLEYGRTLWSAESVTLAGTADAQNESSISSFSEASRQGANVRAKYVTVRTNEKEGWQETIYQDAYFSDPAAGALVVNNNEAIRNFQSLFANGVEATDADKSAASAVQNAADNVDKDAPIIAGTGSGSYLAVKEDAVLAIYQEAGKGGIYKGAICGVNEAGDGVGINTDGTLVKGGTVVKYGAGDFALILEGANYEKLALLEGGKVVVNITAIDLDPGRYNWSTNKWERDPGLYVASGVNLTIIENATSTLKTRIQANDLRFSTSAQVSTLSGNVDVSDGHKPGTIELAVEQRFVKGVVYVENGLTLVLTAEDLAGYTDENGVYQYYDENGTQTFSGGSIGLSSAVCLTGGSGENAQVSTLTFNNTNQKINNLTGDVYSKVDLGRSRLTIVSSDRDGTANGIGYNNFSGAVTGVGNIVKEGTETLTLKGGATISHMGATILKQGGIEATQSQSLWNSSLLWMNDQTKATFTGAQNLVSLAGDAGAVLSVDGDLRLGMDASRRSVLNSAYQATDGKTLGIIVTDELGNSDRVLNTYRNASDELVRTYLKPILDYQGSGLTAAQADALVSYFKRQAADSDVLKTLFGRPIEQGSLTVADITKLYIKLSTGKETDLAFNGNLTAKNITKIGSDYVKISGKVAADSLRVAGGVFEIDGSVYGETGEDGEIVFKPTLNDGITVDAGAKFVVKIDGTAQPYEFSKLFGGDFNLDGTFEKTGDGSLILDAKGSYFGETLVSGGNLTMTLTPRTTADEKAQGDITVCNAGSTLTFNQTAGEAVVWAGTLENKGDLIKTGSGILTLNGSTILEGALKVEAGTLVLQDAEFEGSGKSIVIAKGATLVLDESEVRQATIDRVFEGSGTLEKSGAEDLVLTGAKSGTFNGLVSVREGGLYLEGENLFSKDVSVSVDVAGTVYVGENQTIKNLAGTGDVKLDGKATLSVALANTDEITYSSASGVYRKNDADVSEFVSYSGNIGVYGSEVGTRTFEVTGTGSFVFAGKMDEGTSLAVSGEATLIRTLEDLKVAGDVTLNGDKTRVIFDVGGNDEVSLDGEIISSGAHTVGKIGTGKLIVDNPASWVGADLQVLEGTLHLDGSEAFDFNSAVVVEGAVLELECNPDITPILSEIEGSGTIALVETDSISSAVLEFSKTTMLGVTPNADGKYFNGILDAGSLKVSAVGAGLKLTSIKTTGGFETGAERVALVQGYDTSIGGNFVGNVVVSGDGCLTVEDAYAKGTIVVDNGNVCLNAKASTLNNVETGGLRVKNNASVYFVSDKERNGRLSDVEVRAENLSAVGKISLIKSSQNTTTLDFGSDVDGGKTVLNVADDLWATLTDGSSKRASLVLAVSEGELVLSGLDRLNKAVALKTQDDGTLVVRAELDEALNHSIAGDGNVVFRGPDSTSVFANQDYTGTTTLEAHSKVNFENVTLATSSLVIEKDAAAEGCVKLLGESSTFKNYGRFNLDVGDGDYIEYANKGAFVNEGEIYLSGAGATIRGNELVLFKVRSGEEYSADEMELLFGNGKLTNGTTALMVAQSNGAISAYAIGTSFGATDGLHDGLAGSFTDTLDKMAGVDVANETGLVFESELKKISGTIGAALNRLTEDALPGEIANLSPIGYASMIAMARNSVENDRRSIAERTSHRRYDLANELSESGAEFFARTQASVVENSGSADAANYDFNTYGAVAGFDVKPDDFSLYGFMVGYDYGSATLHNGGGKIRSDSLRATAFSSHLLGDGSLFLDLGLHFGLNDYEVDRRTLVGNAEGDTSGWHAGASAMLGKGFLLKKNKDLTMLVTPYVGLSYLFTKVDSLDESGESGLDVDSFDAQSVRGSIGATVDWKFPLGDWETRISLDAAYHHEFIDDEADIEAKFKQYDAPAFKVSGAVGSSDAFSLAPSVTIDLSERASISFGYALQYGTDEQINHNFNAGFRRCF